MDEQTKELVAIGGSVNEAARIEALCRTLSRPLLISADFAKVCTCHPLVSLGHHRLRGVGEPQEIFTPAPESEMARVSPARAPRGAALQFNIGRPGNSGKCSFT